MEWSKIKNIILLILLGLNLILLIIVGDQQYQSDQVARNTRFQVLQTLSENGVSVSEEILPENTALPVLQVEGDATLTLNAQALLGPCTQNESSDARVVYTSTRGTAELYSSGRFLLQANAGVYTAQSGQEAQAGQEALALMGLTVRILEQSEENGLVSVTYCQLWEGVPIFDALCAAVFEDGELLSLSGQRVSGTASTLEVWELTDVPTTLIRFLNWKNQERLVFSSITAMEAGYQSSSGRTALLTPVWCITTETGRYTVDPNGNVEALSLGV